MSRPPAIAAGIAAVLWAATPVAAAADLPRHPQLVAQIAQATQEDPPAPDEVPPLTEDPFDDQQPEDGGPGAGRPEAEPLAATGAEAALLALLGLGLLTAGFGLRNVAAGP